MVEESKQEIPSFIYDFSSVTRYNLPSEEFLKNMTPVQSELLINRFREIYFPLNILYDKKYILGPYSISLHVNEIFNKKIYIIGEYHSEIEHRSCDRLPNEHYNIYPNGVPIQPTSENTITIEDLLRLTFADTSVFIDFYLEWHKNRSDVLESSSTLGTIYRYFGECFEHGRNNTLNQNNPKCKLHRSHYVDTRFFTNNISEEIETLNASIVENNIRDDQIIPVMDFLKKIYYLTMSSTDKNAEPFINDNNIKYIIEIFVKNNTELQKIINKGPFKVCLESFIPHYYKESEDLKNMCNIVKIFCNNNTYFESIKGGYAGENPRFNGYERLLNIGGSSNIPITFTDTEIKILGTIAYYTMTLGAILMDIYTFHLVL